MAVLAGIQSFALPCVGGAVGFNVVGGPLSFMGTAFGSLNGAPPDPFYANQTDAARQFVVEQAPVRSTSGLFVAPLIGPAIGHLAAASKAGMAGRSTSTTASSSKAAISVSSGASTAAGKTGKVSKAVAFTGGGKVEAMQVPLSGKQPGGDRQVAKNKDVGTVPATNAATLPRISPEIDGSGHTQSFAARVDGELWKLLFSDEPFTLSGSAKGSASNAIVLANIEGGATEFAAGKNNVVVTLPTSADVAFGKGSPFSIKRIKGGVVSDVEPSSVRASGVKDAVNPSRVHRNSVGRAKLQTVNDLRPSDVKSAKGQVHTVDIGKAQPGKADAPHFIVTTEVGGLTVRRHFIGNKDQSVFAGWDAAEVPAELFPMWQASGNSAQLPWVSDSLRVLGFGLPGGETAFKQPIPEGEDAPVGERLTALLMAQLKAGPEFLVDGSMLSKLNAFLAGNPNSDFNIALTPEDWEAYLKETLRLAIRHTPVFNEGGSRSSIAIQSDAARLLGLNPNLFLKWEDKFDIDSISMQLSGKESPDFGDDDLASTKRRFLRDLSAQVGDIAGIVLNIPNQEITFGMAEETFLQWQLAQLSFAEDSGERLHVLSQHLNFLFENGERNMAGRALAIIFKCSEMNEFPSHEGGILPRMAAGEMKKFIKILMRDNTWSIPSHRSFRRYLSEGENGRVNEYILAANQDNAFENLAKIDVTQVSDADFWDAVDRTGQDDHIMNTVVDRMLFTASRGEFAKLNIKN